MKIVDSGCDGTSQNNYGNAHGAPQAPVGRRLPEMSEMTTSGCQPPAHHSRNFRIYDSALPYGALSPGPGSASPQDPASNVGSVAAIGARLMPFGSVDRAMTCHTMIGLAP